MKIKGLLFSMVLLIFSCSSNQKLVSAPQNSVKEIKNIKIFEQSDKSKLGPCEPSIYINPKNTNNIVVGSVIDYVHVSFDTGKTWETKSMSSDFGVWGDPCLVADTNGNFYYFHLSDPEGTNWSSKQILDRMVMQKSTDGGKNWSKGTSIGKHEYPKQQDKEWATVNPFNNDLYLTWTEFDKYGSSNQKHHSRILFSSSKDSGKTWSKTTVLSELEGNSLDNNQTVEGAVPAVGINGEIYCAWSLDNQIYFDKSLDGGKTWLEKDIIATSQPKGWGFKIPGMNRTNGMPVTCVDLSKSEYKGTIYINFSDQRNGSDNTDVFIVKSVDQGVTWSKPIRVNNDQTNSHQFLTWMSVDPKSGFIYIVFYDRSKYNDVNTDVVLAVSKDGGKTFTNTTISESPFMPKGRVFFGDYNNINAYDGIVRPVWTRLEDGKLSIWTCLLNFNN